jgi:tetratricopeptide (TPR) repeat protein
MNLGKKSASLSFGGRGFRYTVSTTGRTTQSMGIPGTGVSYVSSSSGRRSVSTRNAAGGALPPRPPELVKPGLLSPGYEKRFYEGLQAYLVQDFAKAKRAFEAASAGDSRNVSDELFAGIVANALGNQAKAIGYMERVVASATELPDQLMRKYLANASVQLQVSITAQTMVLVEPSSLGAALMLAELYQGSNRLEEAIGILEQLEEEEPDNILLKLSLCDLLYEDEDFEGILDVATEVENDSDEALGCLILKAKALLKMGMASAGVSVLNDCLKRTKRDSELLKEARYARAEAYASTGKPAMARKDWERLYAADPKYRDVGDKLKS